MTTSTSGNGPEERPRKPPVFYPGLLPLSIYYSDQHFSNFQRRRFSLIEALKIASGYNPILSNYEEEVEESLPNLLETWEQQLAPEKIDTINSEYANFCNSFFNHLIKNSTDPDTHTFVLRCGTNILTDIEENPDKVCLFLLSKYVKQYENTEWEFLVQEIYSNIVYNIGIHLLFKIYAHLKTIELSSLYKPEQIKIGLDVLRDLLKESKHNYIKFDLSSKESLLKVNSEVDNFYTGLSENFYRFVKYEILEEFSDALNELVTCLK